MSRIAAALLIVLFSSSGPAQESRPEGPPVATIDGHPVTRDELVRHLLEARAAEVIDKLVLDAVLALELAKAGFKASESELGWDDLQRLQPEEKSTQHLFPESQRKLLIGRTLIGYEIASLGQDPPPPAGLVAEVRQRDGTESRQITEDQAVVAMLRELAPGALREAVTELVDSLLIARELARTGKAVTDGEVAAWEASVRKKFPPPFDWTMICRYRGTTPQRERARWRTVEAWKRLTGWRLDEKELETFHEQNKARFSGKHSTETQPVMNRDLGDPAYRSWVVDELEQKHFGVWLAALRAKSGIWIAPDAELARIVKGK